MGQKHLGLGTDSVGPLYETANLFAISLYLSVLFSMAFPFQIAASSPYHYL